VGDNSAGTSDEGNASAQVIADDAMIKQWEESQKVAGAGRMFKPIVAASNGYSSSTTLDCSTGTNTHGNGHDMAVADDRRRPRPGD